MTLHELPDEAYERIARSLTGEAGVPERAELERLAASDPALGALLADARRGWMAAERRAEVDVERGWSSLQSRLRSTPQNDIASLPVRRSWLSSGVMLRAAAAMILFVGAVAVWRRVGDAPGMAAAVATAETGIAQQRVVELLDGSRVELAAMSSLRTLDGYGGEAREVELQGEATFFVEHDEKRPFRIRTATTFIEDLGTTFTVRALPESEVRVAVSEGIVRVRRNGAAEGDAVVLQARDVAVVADTGDPVVTRGIDVEPYQAWSRGRLDFRGTPLAEVIADLERWYDVDFQVADSTLLARPVTVPFDRQSIDEVLEILGTTLEVAFERRGRIVTLAAPTRTGARNGLPGAQVGSGA